MFVLAFHFVFVTFLVQVRLLLLNTHSLVVPVNVKEGRQRLQTQCTTIKEKTDCAERRPVRSTRANKEYTETVTVTDSEEESSVEESQGLVVGEVEQNRVSKYLLTDLSDTA